MNCVCRPGIINGKTSQISANWLRIVWISIFRQQIVKFLDLTLLKDLTYVNIALGVTFVTFSDGTFFILLPMYLFKLEFSKVSIFRCFSKQNIERNELFQQINAATVASIASASDLIGRITLAVLSCFISINARYVFLAGAILQIILRFGIVYSRYFRRVDFNVRCSFQCF